MSTKVYNGYLVKGDMNWVHKLCLRLRSRVVPWATDYQARWVARTAVNEWDRARYEQRALDRNPVVAAWEEFVTRYRKTVRENAHDPECDVNVEIAVHRGPPGRTLVRLFTQHEELRALWEAFPSVHSYAYWDNADPPQELTPRQWNQRRRNWNRVVKNEDSRGFVFSCLGLYLGVPLGSSLDSYLPNFPSRVESLAVRLAFQDFVRENGGENYEALTAWVNLSGGERETLVLEQRVKVAAVLDPTLTYETIRSSPPIPKPE